MKIEIKDETLQNGSSKVYAKSNRKEDWNGKQLWRNPVDNRVYATDGAPTYSFDEANGYPIYDYNVHFDAVKTAKDKLGTSYQHDAFSVSYTHLTLPTILLV